MPPYIKCSLILILSLSSSNATVEPGQPGTPVTSDVTATSCTLNWTPPTDDGGSPITGYTIEKRDRFSPRWTKVNAVPVEETTFKVPGLNEGSEYEFRVIAENKAGLGKPSEASTPIVAKPPYG